MDKHIWNNSEWLQEQYKTLSQGQIADLVGVTPQTIRAAFKRFNIKSRTISERRQLNIPQDERLSIIVVSNA